MKLEGEQTLLRVHLRNTDKHGWVSAADTQPCLSVFRRWTRSSVCSPSSFMSPPVGQHDAEAHRHQTKEDTGEHVSHPGQAIAVAEQALRLVFKGGEGRVGAGKADGNHQMQIV